MGYNKNAPATVRFRREGNIPVRIVDCDLAAPRFETSDPEAFDVCVKVQATDSDECDWWTGQISSNYGIGNNSHRTRAEMTMETLGKIGLENGDLTKLTKLIGVETVAWIKATDKGGGKVYYNVAGFGGGAGPEPQSINPKDALKRMVAIMAKQAGIQTPKPPTSPAPVMPVCVEDPFADME